MLGLWRLKRLVSRVPASRAEERHLRDVSLGIPLGLLTSGTEAAFSSLTGHSHTANTGDHVSPFEGTRGDPEEEQRVRKRVFLIMGALAGLLALGVATTVVIAQESNDDDKNSFSDDFVERVAEILDEDEDTVRDAMETAREETKEAWKEKWEQAYRDKLDEKLDAAVEAGKITQDEADEYLDWYDDRPDGASFGRSFGRHGKGFGHQRWGK